MNELRNINDVEKQLIEKEMYLEQQLRINALKEQIDQIQDNIVSARLGTIHSNILSNEEINEYKFDLHKLSNIRTGLARYINNAIIFAIKIPTGILETDKK